MPFDISISNQCLQLEDEIKTKLYGKLFAAANKSRWVRISGLGVAIATSLITIALRIAYIFELIIKGVVNLLGAPCKGNCRAKKGAKQLFQAFPMALLGLIGSIAQSLFHLPNKTMRIAIEPIEFFSKRWIVHNIEFKELVAEAKENRAAFFYLGKKFAETNLPKKDQLAFESYQKAAEEKFLPAVCQLASCYYSGKGVQKNVPLAIKIMQKLLNACPHLMENLQKWAQQEELYWQPVIALIKEQNLKPIIPPPDQPAQNVNG